MAFNPRDYPRDWQEIREKIRQRSGNRCEGCVIHPDCRAVNGEPHPVTGSKVVLTVAHWPDPDKRIGDLAGLRHLCQRCHLALDRPHHLAVQRRRREERKRREQPVLELELV